MIIHLIKYYILPISLLFSTKSFCNSNIDTIFLCYGKVPVHQITNFKYVILEEVHYTKEEITQLKQKNEKVLCYISLGEIHKYVSFFKEAKNYTLEGKNTIWDSYYLDLNQKPLQEILLKNIQEKLTKGFDGLFLDNIDNYGPYGKQKKQTKKLVEFLTTIKSRFPEIYLMQNAGLAIIKQTHTFINSVAIESVITNYNFEKKKYLFREKKESKKIIERLKKIEEDYKLPILLIEYTESKRKCNKIKRKLNKYDWPVFIGQINLQKKPTFN
ncbi:hypothetical protein CXF68_00915 [Tenacibaculum sp. Bg11-29]|nr:hypothetical protein CXF68_00915 [Tenacibaculum sp. Bg11-29]